MKLITKEVEKNLSKYPLYSQDEKGFDAKIVVKFFNPFGAGTWLVTEGEKQDNGKWEFFGYCYIFEWEWGYFTEEELESIHPFKGFPSLGIERDMYLDKNITVGEYLKKYENQTTGVEEKLEIHKTLNPSLFTEDKKLVPEIRNKLVDEIVEDYKNEVEERGIEFPIKDIVLVGSNMSFNYTKDSDLDTHIIIDSSQLPEEEVGLYSLLYDAYRGAYNKKHDITIKKIPVELYVEMDNTNTESNGVYSVLNDEWIKEPTIENAPKINEEEYNKIYDEYEERYLNIIEPFVDTLKQDIEESQEITEAYRVKYTRRGQHTPQTATGFETIEDAQDFADEIEDEHGSAEIIDEDDLPAGTLDAEQKERDRIERMEQEITQKNNSFKHFILYANHMYPMLFWKEENADKKGKELIDEGRTGVGYIELWLRNDARWVGVNHSVVPDFSKYAKKKHESIKTRHTHNKVEEELLEAKQDELNFSNKFGDKLTQRFLAIRNKLSSPENDYYYWIKNKNEDELINYLDTVENTKSKNQQKQEMKVEGSELVYNKDDWKVYKILTYEASKYYGKGTKWCITGNNGSNGREYFNSYKRQGVKDYYFIISPTDQKWCYLDYGGRLDRGQFFNAPDQQLDPNNLESDTTGFFTIPLDIFNILPNINQRYVNKVKFEVEIRTHIEKDFEYTNGVLTVKKDFEDETSQTKRAIRKYLKDNETIKAKTVNIEEGITTIPSTFFSKFLSLSTLNLANSVKVIEEGAFSSTPLKELDLSNVEEIEDSAFSSCSQLKKVTLNSNTKYLGYNVFSSDDIDFYIKGKETSESIKEFINELTQDNKADKIHYI